MAIPAVFSNITAAYSANFSINDSFTASISITEKISGYLVVIPSMMFSKEPKYFSGELKNKAVNSDNCMKSLLMIKYTPLPNPKYRKKVHVSAVNVRDTPIPSKRLTIGLNKKDKIYAIMKGKI